MKKNIIKLTILVFLTSLWLLLTLKYISKNEFGLTTLVSLFKFEKLTFSRPKNLLKGDIASGEFISKYPKMGIISIRFNNHDRINKDKLEFRIKEIGKEWYYQAVYNTDQFQKGELFPFGFPPVEDSQNKKYYFEIESLSGSLNDSVSIDPAFPTIVNHHVYSKNVLLGSPRRALYFLKQKLIFFLTQPIFLYQSLIFAIPLIFYILIGFFKTGYKAPFILLFVLIIYDIKSHTVFSDFMYGSVIIIWLAVLFKYRLNSNIFAPQIVTLFAAMVLFATVNQLAATEKAATWLYLMLATGLIHFVIPKVRSFILKR